MTLNEVLLSFFENVGATGDTYLVDWDTTQDWPAGALERLLEAGILTSASSAQSLVCKGCENLCYMDVHTQRGEDNLPSRAFIVCDHPEMQAQMGRIQIPLERLEQWKIAAFQLTKVIASLLGIENQAGVIINQTNFRIGMLKGKNGRRWLSLNISPLSIEINKHTIPLEEVLYFDDGDLVIDQTHLVSLIDKTPGSSSKKYTPSTDRREERKRETKAMYENWRDEYKTLKIKHPGKSDVWYSRKIENMEIANSRDSETIRKNMKK